MIHVSAYITSSRRIGIAEWRCYTRRFSFHRASFACITPPEGTMDPLKRIHLLTMLYMKS